MTPLPIDALLPEIVSVLSHSSNLVIEAPPGAGKSTRVPPALLSLVRSEIVVLEPRRIAARMAARQVAAELGEKVGETAGYQVRFEEAGGPATRLRFLTEGVLTRRLLSNPTLNGVDVVIFDEFHERHLEGDIALALLRRLQRTLRPDLKLVVMSATLDSGPVAAYLNCSILRAEGRLWPLTITYTPNSAEPLEMQAAAAVERAIREHPRNDILVFLPGAAEIRKTAAAVERLAHATGRMVCPLHGDLSLEEQDLAVRPAPQPKVILSTNVAESSITIEGVRAVIDSGLARIAADSPWTGLPALKVSRISRASADQRAGRAGRTGPGSVIRLYTEEDYRRRPAHDLPEIQRRELVEACLLLLSLGLPDPREMDWLDVPPGAAVTSALSLLARLGVVDSERRLTPVGKRTVRFPMHPRLGRLVVESIQRGKGEDGCRAAAILSAGERLPPETHEAGPSDILYLMDWDLSGMARRHYEQIRRAVRPPKNAAPGEEGLLLAILAAFPDRVMKRRAGNDMQLANGSAAKLAPQSVVRTAPFVVAVDIEERGEHSVPLVRMASAIEPEWLMDLFPDRITERSTLEWNRSAERVEVVSALLYESLALTETRGGQPDPIAASELLAAKAIEAGVARFGDVEDVERFVARVAFASRHSEISPLSPLDIEQALKGLCQGLRSFAELQSAAAHGGLLRAIEALIPRNVSRLLEEVAPLRLRLPSGRHAAIDYSAEQRPMVASRLQDFFGMRETPRIARGKVPLTLSLLAPNGRPVQVTSDLAGFWERLYPQVRRELSRRYPKHLWPEKPV